MDILPTWFTDSPEHSRRTFLEKIQEFVDCKDSDEIALKIEEFIKIIGFLNKSTFEAFLPETTCKIFATWLKKKNEDIQKIIELSLTALIQTGEPDYEKIESLFQLSVFSTNNIFHSLIQEVTFYLLSQPMPIQNSLGFYSVSIFQKALDVRQGKLMKTVQFVFDMTLSKEKLDQTLSQIEVKFDFGNFMGSIGNLFLNKQDQFRGFLSLEEEQFLFKYAALKGDGLFMSYGHFLISWARKSSYGKPLLDLIHTCFCFDKFLIKEGDSEANSKTSLQNSLIESTLHIFFKSQEKAIPTGEWRNALKQLFCESEQTRLDSMDYIDELKKRASIVPFPFAELLSILNVDFPDKTSTIYQFLHSSLHFFCPLNLRASTVPQEHFRRFYEMKLEERLHLDGYLISIKDILKLEMIKCLGEKQMDDISLVLEELNGALLSHYVEFFKAVNKAKEEITKAIERSEEVDNVVIKDLKHHQEMLDEHLLEEKIGEQINEQKWDLLKTKVYNKCMRDFSFSKTICLLKSINNQAFTLQAKEQIIQACADGEFLKKLQGFLKKFKDVIEAEERAFQDWIKQKKISKRPEKKYREIDSIMTRLKHHADASLYFTKIRDDFSNLMAYHQQVIRVVDGLKVPLALTTRQRLIESLKSVDICDSFEGFLTTFNIESSVTEADILMFVELQKTDVIRDLFRLPVWKVPDTILDQIIEKIENKEVALILTNDDHKNLAIAKTNKNSITHSKACNQLPEIFNKRIDKLKKLVEFSRHHYDLEYLKSKIEKRIKILDDIKRNEKLIVNEDDFENWNSVELKQISNLKKFRADDILQQKLKGVFEQNPYPFTDAQSTIFDLSYMMEIDKIVASYTFKIDGSNAFSQFYIKLANTLHQTFTEESGMVEIIKDQPLPSLKQLKFALKLLQSNMEFLISASFTLAERIAVAELLRIIMIGEEKAKSLEALTSDFAFTWAEAANYRIDEEVSPLPNMDILKSLLNLGSFINETEKSRNQLLNSFFLDRDRFIITRMDLKMQDKLVTLNLYDETSFFEDLRTAYFNFLQNHIDAMRMDLIYNEVHSDFISPTVTAEDFTNILKQHCEAHQVQKVVEIVKATTFSTEQIKQLQILLSEVDETKLQSLLRIRVLRCMVIWTQALLPVMLYQKMCCMNQANPFSFYWRMAEQNLYGSANGDRVWEVDESLNSMATCFTFMLNKGSNPIVEAIYTQMLSMTNITASNPDDSKVQLSTVAKLFVSPHTDIETLDKLDMALRGAHPSFSVFSLL